MSEPGSSAPPFLGTFGTDLVATARAKAIHMLESHARIHAQQGPLTPAHLDLMRREINQEHQEMRRMEMQSRELQGRVIQTTEQQLFAQGAPPHLHAQIRERMAQQMSLVQERHTGRLADIDQIRDVMISTIEAEFPRVQAGHGLAPAAQMDPVAAQLMRIMEFTTTLTDEDFQEMVDRVIADNLPPPPMIPYLKPTRTAPLPEVRMKCVSQNPDPCVICMEAFADLNEQVPLLPCPHEFHSTCWTTYMQSKDTNEEILCPLCRAQIYT